MSKELETLLTGVCISVFVCVISSVLYYMFKHAAVVHSTHIPVALEVTSSKKKKRKQDPRRSKKAKHLMSFGDSIVPTEPEVDKSQTSDETLDDNIDSLLHRPFECSETHQLTLSPCQAETDSDPESDKRGHESHSMVVGSVTHQSLPSEASYTISCISESLSDDFNACEFQNASCNLTKEVADCVVANKVHSNYPEPSILTTPSECILPLSSKSKRSKKRAARRVLTTNLATDGISVPLYMPNVEHVVEPVEELTKSAASFPVNCQITCSSDDINLTESREEVAKLTDQLRATEQKLSEISIKAAELSRENEHMHTKAGENALGLRVLQQQYTELLRTNKTLEHEKNLKETSLKNLTAENKNLLAQLDQVVKDAARRKEECVFEVRKLQDEVMEVKSKLTLLSSVPPPAPSPDLIRTQELVQLMSNENLILKSTLEQVKAEVGQLRQTNLVQQQELQRLRAENLKLRDDQESALGELRTKHQAEKVVASSRVATFEAQLQLQCRELEAEKQELAVKLSEARTEISLRLDREKRLSEIISSLEYQFAELNAEKQVLLGRIDSSKANHESATNELLVRVANLTNELASNTTKMRETQQRADVLTTELERLKCNALRATKRDAMVCTERFLFVGDAESMEHSTAEGVLKSSVSEILDAFRLDETSNAEVNHYKSTLVQTDGLLAQLQEFVQDAEIKWHRSLAESEAQRIKLEKDLAMALAYTSELDERLKRTEEHRTQLNKDTRRLKPKKQRPPHTGLVDVYSLPNSTRTTDDNSVAVQVEKVTSSHIPSPACIEDLINTEDNIHKPCEGSSFVKPSSQLLDLGDSDADHDFDAVLIDDTDLHVPDDIWDSTTKMSENSSISDEPLNQGPNDHQTVSETYVVKQL